MVFRYADMGIHNPHGAFSILIIFCILAVGPRLTNMVSPGIAFFVNIICIFALMLLGCHNVIMSNHSTFVLAYLLLQGYDVSGHDYTLRLIGLLVGAASTALILYRNHKKMSYKRSFRHLFQEFDLSSARTRWQIRLTLGVSSAMLIASLLGIPRVMWIGIAAMSVLLPFRKDMEYRVKFRAPGNILGAICFLVLYTVLPESCYSYIGMIGGIGVGLSATYGWQTVFNSFGALAIATPIFGLPMAIFLRIFNNAFGSLYALAFDNFFYICIDFLKINLALSIENTYRYSCFKSIHHRIIFFFKIVHDHFFSIRIYQPILSHSGGHILVQLKHQILLSGRL